MQSFQLRSVRLIRPLLLVLACAVLLGAGRQAGAQAETSGRVIIHGAEVADQGDSLGLTLTFRLVDEAGLPLRTETPTEATVHLDDGGVYPAVVAPSETPAYVLILMDASGSMRPAAEEMRQAAIAAAAATPAGTNLAVATFDESVSLLVPFTAASGEIVSAAGSVEVGQGSTCLIDTLGTAVESLNQVAPEGAQRSIILLTDGFDEVQRGGDASCSERTFDEVTGLLRQSPVPIQVHAVGFRGLGQPADANILGQIAGERGTAVIADETFDAAAHFAGVMDGLGRSWTASSEVYTQAGAHTAALFVTTESGSTFAGSTGFSAPRDVSPPDVHSVGVRVSDFGYDAALDQFALQATLTNPEAVTALRVELWDRQNNRQVQAFTRDTDGARRVELLLGTALLAPGGIYEARLFPLDAGGAEFEGVQGENVQAQHPFQYAPPGELQLVVEAVRPDYERGQLVVDLQIENGAELESFAGRYVDANAQTEVSTFGPFTRVGDLVFVPLPAEPGTFEVVVNGLDAEGSILDTVRHTFVYTPSVGNALLETAELLQENPPIWAGSLTVIVLLLALEALLLTLYFRRKVRRVRAAAVAAAAPNTSAAWHKPDAGEALLRVEQTLNPYHQGSEVRIRSLPFSVGRENADLIITGDRQISREHLAITYTDGQYYVTDLRSSNGTRLDGTPLGAQVTTPLPSGALLQLGNSTRLRFLVTAEDTATTPAGNGHALPAEPPVAAQHG